MDEKSFEQKVRKVTKGRKLHETFGRLCGVGKPLAQLGCRTNSVEVARTQVNSRELFNGGKSGNGRQKPDNYEEWSKSLEVARTFASNFPARENSRAEEN